MNRNTFLRVAAMALAIGSMGTAMSAKRAMAEERPFMAKLAGNAHLTPTGDPSVLLNHETGAGEATHLGQFQWEDDEVATFGAGGVSVVASFTMTAANGDKVYGEFTSSGSFDEDGNLVIEGSYQVTGGSGRFDGAVGSGTISAVAFLSPGLPFIGSFNGTIDF